MVVQEEILCLPSAFCKGLPSLELIKKISFFIGKCLPFTKLRISSGLVPFLAHNGVNSYVVSQVKANAAETSLAPVLDYLATRKTTPNESTFGIAKDRDVVYIHLESIQQFLIDYKHAPIFL